MWRGRLLLTVALLLVLFTTADVFAERPDTCAPEDREIAGNLTTDCRWDFHADRITTVEYTVVENTAGDSCHEELVFSPFNGMAEWEHLEGAAIWFAELDANGTPNWPRGESAYRSEQVMAPMANSVRIGIGGNFTLDSSVPPSPGWSRNESYGLRIDPSQYPVVKVRFSTGRGNLTALNPESDRLPMPVNINDFNLLMNDCLAGIKQRLDNAAKLEKTRQRVEAERVALERTAKEAEAEAERQRLETDAAREALRLARETELAKTQSLIQQLEREKVIIGIWQEVVLEKQQGVQARAEITNRYLTEIEANAAEFKASVVAKAEEIRRLEEINAAIADAIIAHNDEVERQIVVQAELEAEQRARLEDLTVDVPEPTPTATP